MITCSQKGCTNAGICRYTFPQQEEAFVCDMHIDAVRGAAKGLGVEVELIQLTYNELMETASIGELESMGIAHDAQTLEGKYEVIEPVADEVADNAAIESK